MKTSLAMLLCTGCAFAVGPVLAQPADLPPPLMPETITVRESIAPGPNLFIMNSGWDGLSTLNVYDAETLDYKGGMPAGLTGQSAITADGATAYTISTYLRRIIFGDTEMVLQRYDVDSMVVEAELMLPPKIVMVAAHHPMLVLSADESFIFIQNATPATSVTVVNLETWTVAAEIPTPGCYSIHAAPAGLKFTMLCGDGTMATFVLDDAGATVTSQMTTPIFDVDDDPLFIHSERVGDDLVFVSFNGNVYRVSDAGPAPSLAGTFSGTGGGDYAPGGYDVLAYNAANDLLFVTMHAEPYDGSHKDSGEHLFVIDLSEGRVLAMAETPPLVSLWVDDAAMPTLYGYDEEEGAIHIFAVDPATGALTAGVSGGVTGGPVFAVVE